VSWADERCWQIIGFVWFAETHAIEFLRHSVDEVALGLLLCRLRSAPRRPGWDGIVAFVWFGWIPFWIPPLGYHLSAGTQNVVRKVVRTEMDISAMRTRLSGLTISAAVQFLF